FRSGRFLDNFEGLRQWIGFVAINLSSNFPETPRYVPHVIRPPLRYPCCEHCRRQCELPHPYQPPSDRASLPVQFLPPAFLSDGLPYRCEAWHYPCRLPPLSLSAPSRAWSS